MLEEQHHPKTLRPEAVARAPEVADGAKALSAPAAGYAAPCFKLQIWHLLPTVDCRLPEAGT